MRSIPSRSLTLLLVFTPFITAPETSIAQGPPSSAPPAVAAAQAALQAGQPDSAIRTLERFFTSNPAAVQGRLILGNAYAQQGDFDKAIAAYQKISVPRPLKQQATFLIAGIYAKRGNTDSAFKYLGDLKTSGAYDMDLLRTTPDLASLQSDARFAALMFRASEFSKPFVEPVRVIHEWRGETKGDQFGWIARGIGDVDGDKVMDVVTSAPSFGAAGKPSGRGRVYVYSGKTGKLLWQQTGAEGENLGTGLEGAGDVNHDGVGDVIAGAPGSGHAYVYSGRDGRVLLTLTGTVQEGFGSTTSGAGDQNGDGYADLLVGAPSSNASAQGAGRVYVLSGKDGTVLRHLDGGRAGEAFGSIVAGQKWGRGTPILVGAPGGGPRQSGKVYSYAGVTFATGMPIDGDSTGIALGAMFTSVIGDVDGDKIPDLYATDFTNGAKGPSTGRAYVNSGADGRRLYTLTGEGPGDGFGIGSADVGDVNHDGHADMLIGAWQYSAAAPSGGKVYLYSGKDGTLLRSITGRIAGETLGFDATGVGDVDGDGVIDLLVTSAWSNVNGFRTGRMFLISGKSP